MTRPEIEKLKAGKELDRLIGERVYGYQYLEIGYWQPGWKSGDGSRPSDSSTPELQSQLSEWLDKPVIVEQYDNAVGEYLIDVKSDTILSLRDTRYSKHIELTLTMIEHLLGKIYASIKIAGVVGDYQVEIRGIDCSEFAVVLGSGRASTLALALCKAALEVTLTEILGTSL